MKQNPPIKRFVGSQNNTLNTSPQPNFNKRNVTNAYLNVFKGNHELKHEFASI